MAIVQTLGDTGDGALSSDDWLDQGGVNANPNFETNAKTGTNVAIDPDGEPLSGQKLAIGGQKWGAGKVTSRNEAFIAFRKPQAPVGIGELELVDSTIRHGRYGKFHDGAPYPDDSIRWFNRSWSAPVTNSAWVDLNPLSGDNTPLFETKNWIQDGADSLYEVSGRQQFAQAQAAVAAGTDLAYMLTLTSATGTYPLNKNANFLGYIPSANHTLLPSHFRPYAIMRYVRRHALNHVLGASIQLPDGTAVFLRFDMTNERFNLYYQKVGQTTPTLILALGSKTPSHDWSSGWTNFFAVEPGNQTMGITCDASFNIYVVGSRGNEQPTEYDTQFFNILALKYTGTISTGSHSWTTGASGTSGDQSTLASVLVHRGQPNNFAPVWLPSSQGGSKGQLCVMHSRRNGQWSRYQMGITSEYAGYWLDSLPSGQRLHGIGWAGDDTSVSTWWRPWNSAATGMDAFRDGNTIRYASFIQAPSAWYEERSAVGRVVVPSSGLVPALTFLPNSVSGNTPHDPDAKIRALWLGEQSPYYGIARHGHIELHRKSDDTIFKQRDVAGSGVTGFPSRADLQKSAAWDVIAVTNQDRIAIYYRDNNNARKLRRVFWDYQTDVMSASEEFTTTALGSSGDDIVAIRLPRQATDTRCILIDVAMQDGAGAPTGLITLRDTSLDVPPAAPTIAAIDQFNASGTKAIEWTFHDGNALDFATFQDVEIRNLSTGVTAHFVNHVTAVVVDAAANVYRYTVGSSVLTNDTQYQIRIRSYDSVDVVGDWSSWTNFSTTATGGLVQIIEPATDLEPLNKSSVRIVWSYSNTNPSITQLGYRVRVYNDDTGALVTDTGPVTSLVTEYNVTSLVSDVRYRVEVTIADSAAQTSGAGTRIILPDFNNPSIPQIVAIAEQGFIEVQVTNPPPDGENPVTTVNQIARRESGQDETAFVIIGTAPPNGVFRDYTVASGVEYVYKARGQS